VTFNLSDKDLADDLFRNIIRRRGHCELPADELCLWNKILETAHIFSRDYLQIRWSTDNALCLCHNCHSYFTNHPKIWKEKVKSKIGETNYLSLQERANTYVKIDYDTIIGSLRKNYL
jgi:hypothetical protein